MMLASWPKEGKALIGYRRDNGLLAFHTCAVLKYNFTRIEIFKKIDGLASQSFDRNNIRLRTQGSYRNFSSSTSPLVHTSIQQCV